MPTDKPLILITLDEELMERIQDYRFGNRIETRSEAIRQLLDKALKDYEKKSA